MKPFWITVSIFYSFLSLSAQSTIRGKITANQLPLSGATISIVEMPGVGTISSSDGNFTFFTKKGSFTLVVEHVSMETKSFPVVVNSQEKSVTIDMNRSAYFLAPVEITSIRASERAPFTKTNISKEELAKNNLGYDLPFLLNQTPGIIVNSDAGNGVGYTGMRIRGSDATRINMTINGIPYNDPESQGVFLVNLPDFASSVSSIQIQRGVGTSSNGAGAFGATVNVSTNEFNPTAYGEFNNSFGSFNTRKHTVKVGSGLINKHFTVDARLSQISSEGFIDRASSKLKSYFLSGGYVNEKSSVRLNIFSGDEQTYQAWYGVPEPLLKTNRTFNSAGTEKPGTPYSNETDNYKQDHYQLFFNHAFTNDLTFNTALFIVEGKGFYEQYKSKAKFSSYVLPNPVVNGTTLTRTDLVRQLWLDNVFYGQIASLNYKSGADNITIGGGWNGYKGKHYGQVIWAEISIPKDHRFYDNDGVKKDANLYAKWQRTLSKRWEVFGDVQYRHANYTANGFRNNPGVAVDRKFNFFNPKAGVSYAYNGWQAYFSYALGNKEPNREDFEAGIARQPMHETLHDFELGLEQRKNFYKWSATAYFMYYKNQLVLNGQVNDVGAYTRVNIPKSYRAGIELQGSVQFSKWINAAANMALSRNKIASSETYIDNYDSGSQEKISYKNTDISFSPAVVAGSTINILPVKNAEISLLSKYVSRQYLDNTEQESRSLNPYFVQDVRLSYTIKSKLISNLQIIAMVNNVLDNKYEANGYTFSYKAGGTLSTENFYFPMAGINYMVGLNLKF